MDIHEGSDEDTSPKSDLPRASQECEVEVENEIKQILYWCKECGLSYKEECEIHGDGGVVSISDGKAPSRARMSLPSVLCLKKIPGKNEDAVFTKRVIKHRSQFGPLEAPLYATQPKADPALFSLKLVADDNSLWIYDQTDEDECNWMIFVRPAKTKSEQNLVAYQSKGKIYFVSTKAIPASTELKVWYAKAYAVKIEKPMLEEDEVQTSSVVEDKPVLRRSTSNKSYVIEDPVENESSESDTQESAYCSSCKKSFDSMRELYEHTCLSNDSDEPMRPTRRKGKPRKIPLRTDDILKNKHVERPRRGRPKLTEEERQNRASIRQAKINVPKEKREKKIKMDTGKKKYVRKARHTCGFCDEKFASEETYRIHISKHTGKAPYECDYEHCGKGFNTRFTYWRHQLTHVKPQNRQCTYCNKSFNRVDHLKIHMRTHDVNRSVYSCDKCGKSYLFKSTYDYHIAIHEAKEGQATTCSICDKKFDSAEELVKHTKSHNRYKSVSNTPKLHPCPVCNRMFGTKKDVRRHSVVHTKEKQYLCEFCPQTFGRKDHLHRHYKCSHRHEVLEQKFANSEEFPCSICLYTFKKEKHLLHHIKTVHPAGEQKQKENASRTPKKKHNTVQVQTHIVDSPHIVPQQILPQDVLNQDPVFTVAGTPTTMVMNSHIPNTQPLKTVPYRFAPQVVSSTQPSSSANDPNSHSGMNTTEPVQQNYANGQDPCSLTTLITYAEQLKSRGIFTSDHQPVHHRLQQSTWSGHGTVTGGADEHSYASGRTKTLNKFTPGPIGDMETIRFIQNLPINHGPFPTSLAAPGQTAMAVGWDTITEYVAVQPVQQTVSLTEIGQASMVHAGHSSSMAPGNMQPH